tara:strand:- start:1306 stop:1557 length:252 start_codon:yes stop_codon:yes gene_type:complete
MGKGKVSIICPDFVMDQPLIGGWTWWMEVLYWFSALFLVSLVLGSVFFIYILLTNKFIGIKKVKVPKKPKNIKSQLLYILLFY